MKERYIVFKDYVDDRGLGVCGNSMGDEIGKFETETEANKEFENYFARTCKEKYTWQDHPHHATFIELSVSREIYDEELDEWEFDDRYCGLRELYQEI